MSLLDMIRSSAQARADEVRADPIGSWDRVVRGGPPTEFEVKDQVSDADGSLEDEAEPLKELTYENVDDEASLWDDLGDQMMLDLDGNG